MTFAPLPSFNHILKCISFKKITDTELAKPWAKNNERIYWFSRSTWSLYAIVKLRIKTQNTEKINIWIPDYFCNASLAPLRELNVNLLFYPILEDYTPNIKACTEMCNSNKPDLIVVVHYFGEPTNLDYLHTIACQYSAWLIEDAAHVLIPMTNIGKHSDFIIYSPHKFLPIPDGGLLVFNKDGPNKISDAILITNDFTKLYKSIIERKIKLNFTSFKWLVKRVMQKTGLFDIHHWPAFKADEALMDLHTLPHPKMTALAKKLLILVLINMEDESVYRVNNRSNWRNKILSTKLIDYTIKPLDSICTPYLAGFSSIDYECIESTFNKLTKHKLPVSTWPDLPPEVSSKPEYHKTAIKFRNTRFFLPVHRSMNNAIENLLL